MRNKRKLPIWMTLSSCCLVAFLSGCAGAGYTPGGRIASWDESIIFFEKNKREFEELRDLLMAEKAGRFIVYAGGDCEVIGHDRKAPKPSKEHVKEYVARLEKLGIINAMKNYTTNPKCPLIGFTISSIGLVGDGSSVELTYTTGNPGISHGRMAKIEKSGWYLDTDQYEPKQESAP